MAKSLRSKFKRKVRAIARTKKEKKATALLQKAIDKREEYEKKEEEKSVLNKDATGEDKMEVTSEATINTKTLKKKDGSFPSWLSGTQKKKAARNNKAIKKAKNKTAKNFR